MRGRLADGHLYAWTLGCWDFYAAEAENFFQKKICLPKQFFVQKQVFFPKRSLFSKLIFLFQLTVLFKKKRFLIVFFFNITCLKTHFFQIKDFSKNKVFPTKNFYLDEIVNFFKALHWTLVKKNCQNRERRKRSAYRKKPSSNWREKDQSMRASFVYCTIFKLYKNSFCRQKAGLKVLIKVTLKADRLEGERKKFYKKIDFLLYFFNNQKCFPLHVRKAFSANLDAYNLQLAVSIFYRAWARVDCASYLLGYELGQLKTFLFGCFWSLPYIWEKIYIT